MTTQEEILITRANEIAKKLGMVWDERLERLLRFSARNPAAFPTSRGKKKMESAADVDDSYLTAYIGRYYRDRDGVIVLKDIKTKPDPAVDEVLKAFKKVSSENLERIGEAHRLSMQAENIVGKLLEGYVAGLLESKGWIWCCGETMRSVDFIKDAEGEDVRLLQVKNRDNSENSSSAAIREGTKIEKWYRSSSRTGKTRWDKLQENSDASEDEQCTEEGFYKFVIETANRKPPVEEISPEEVDE
ncbi:MAG TPA: SinI family restriction endonuclease [Pyrinomonadaceae bacterium]|jgi:hypothetical protein|nr:SinI family restriction endonuclease [Pyrinomonadaceae bacterium]